MRTVAIIAAAIGVVLSTSTVFAQASYRTQSSGAYEGSNGGYHVNRYGYGNYVGGPAGGFGGYPAGSGNAQILKQVQEWKCRDAPERC